MLLASKIQPVTAYQADWLKQKLGKFSASTNSKLFSEESHLGKFSVGAITHIENIAGEIVTGEPCREEFSSEDTDHGNATEPEAIDYFCEKIGKPALRNLEEYEWVKNTDTHRLIIQNEYEACTPDALIAMEKVKFIYDSTGTKLKIAPLEVKCPPKHHRFIKLYKCFTPSQLKNTAKDYYYQVLTQMVYCDSLVGYFAAYNKKFPNPMRIITFNKMEMKDEITKFNLTMGHARRELVRTVELLKQAA